MERSLNLVGEPGIGRKFAELTASGQKGRLRNGLHRARLGLLTHGRHHILLKVGGYPALGRDHPQLIGQRRTGNDQHKGRTLVTLVYRCRKAQGSVLQHALALDGGIERSREPLALKDSLGREAHLDKLQGHHLGPLGHADRAIDRTIDPLAGQLVVVLTLVVELGGLGKARRGKVVGGTRNRKFHRGHHLFGLLGIDKLQLLACGLQRIVEGIALQPQLRHTGFGLADGLHPGGHIGHHPPEIRGHLQAGLETRHSLGPYHPNTLGRDTGLVVLVAVCIHHKVAFLVEQHRTDGQLTLAVTQRHGSHHFGLAAHRERHLDRVGLVKLRFAVRSHDHLHRLARLAVERIGRIAAIVEVEPVGHLGRGGNRNGPIQIGLKAERAALASRRNRIGCGCGEGGSLEGDIVILRAGHHRCSHTHHRCTSYSVTQHII